MKKFRWGRGPQVLSLKPGGGVEGRKIRERQVDALGRGKGREGGRKQLPFSQPSPPVWYSPVRMGK